ncbi:MAG: response regulator [Bacteroidetes bacterium]|nr:response regulator [Bacteroidota bacterium]
MLIAEDDFVSSRMLAKRVEIFAREILFAENGAIAIELLTKNPDIDLIFMDIGMPVMDGFEAIQNIREFNIFRI